MAPPLITNFIDDLLSRSLRMIRVDDSAAALDPFIRALAYELEQQSRQTLLSEQDFFSQAALRARLAQTHDEPQIRIEDTPIEPMAPCASMFAS